MRIAIDVTSRLAGGGAQYLLQVLQAWARQGVGREHEIILFAYPANESLLRPVMGEGVKIHPIPASGEVDRWLSKQTSLVKLLRQYKVDVLLAPANMCPLTGKIPSVVVFHNLGPFCSTIVPSTVGWGNWLWFKTLGVMMRISARKTNRVVFLSHYFQDYFQQRFSLPAVKAEMMYLGRPDVRSERGGALPERLGVEKPYILLVSHLYPYKYLENVILGYARAQRTMEEHGLKLYIVGNPYDKKYHAKLKGLVHNYSLEGRVVLTGNVAPAEVLALMANCHFFVFQSTCENCPVTLIEALTSGLPIACSKIGVMPEIAGNAALYYDPFDPADIARALERMAREPELRQSLREKALIEAQKFPSWDEIAQRVLLCLEQVAKESRSRH